MSGAETVFMMAGIVFILTFLYKLYNVMMFNTYKKKQQEQEESENMNKEWIPTLKLSFLVFVIMILAYGIMFMAVLVQVTEILYMQIFQLATPLFILGFLFQFIEILMYGWTKLPSMIRYNRG